MRIKGQGHFFLFGKGHSDYQNYVLFSLKICLALETKFLVKAYWTSGKKIYTNGFDHKTKIAATLIYGQNLEKSSVPKSVQRWLWNLICNIVYSRSNSDLWPFLTFDLGLSYFDDFKHLLKSHLANCNQILQRAIQVM